MDDLTARLHCSNRGDALTWSQGGGHATQSGEINGHQTILCPHENCIGAMYGFNYAFYAFVIRCLSCDETIREQRNQHCVTGQDEGAQASVAVVSARFRLAVPFTRVHRERVGRPLSPRRER